MKFELGLTERQLRNLNSKAVKDYFGTEDDALTKEDLKERINDVLDQSKELADSANQLCDLESRGIVEDCGGGNYAPRKYTIYDFSDE